MPGFNHLFSIQRFGHDLWALQTSLVDCLCKAHLFGAHPYRVHIWQICMQIRTAEGEVTGTQSTPHSASSFHHDTVSI